MDAATVEAPQFAIVVNAARHGVPVPSNSGLVAVGPSTNRDELYGLLSSWFRQGDAAGRPVPFYIRTVTDDAPDLERTAANAVIHESNGNYLAGWTSDAGYAAHRALFADLPFGVERELIATMYRTTMRAGFPRGAWVIESEVPGAEGTVLAVIGNKRAALKRLREIVADYFTTTAAAAA